MSNSHTKRQELNRAIALNESVWQTSENHDYIYYEKKAAEALVHLKELELEQALLNEKLEIALKNHSIAFRTYLEKKRNSNNS